jgi:hypothetical protein
MLPPITLGRVFGKSIFLQAVAMKFSEQFGIFKHCGALANLIDENRYQLILLGCLKKTLFLCKFW